MQDFQNAKAPSFADFATKVKTDSIAKPSRYFVEIPLPSIMFQSMPSPEDLKMIGLYCEYTQFPEMSLATATMGATGNNIEMPYEKLYGPITMSFICDRDMKVKHFFDSWIQSTVNAVGGVFNYYDDYVVPQIVIYQYDENSDCTYAVVLYNAYPKVVNDVPLGHAMTNDYSKLMVQFTYDHWVSYKMSNTGSTLNAIYPNAATAAEKFGLISGVSASMNPIPGIDVIKSVTGISNVLDLVNKMKNPALLKDSILRSVRSFSYENFKPIMQHALEQLPSSVRQIGGSVLGQATKVFGF